MGDHRPTWRFEELAGRVLVHGHLRVNLKQRTVIHHVQYSSISAWEGTDLVRSFKFRRDRRLTLTIAPSAPGGQTGILRWKKLRIHVLDADGMSE